MTASSITGVGHGSSDKTTLAELGVLANGPSIIFTGIVETDGGLSSPPSTTNAIVFPYTLPGGADSYVVLLTTINAGYVHVTDRDEDSDSNFTGFSFAAEAAGDVMYLVAKVGSKAQI